MRELAARRQVTIVGAGPAGSTAALLLARGGWSVRLIEQHRFPRDKVCGECLSAMGIAVLQRIELSRRIASLEPVILTHAVVHLRRRRSLRIPLPRPMWGISRDVLDQFLLEAARDAGAEIHQPARGEFLATNATLRLRVRDLVTNQIETHSPDHVIVADGKGALLPGPRPRTGDLGIKAHFIDVDGPRDTIELFACRGLYGGLAPIPHGRWNAAFSVPAACVRAAGGNLEAVFENIVFDNRMLRQRLRRARRVGAFLAAPSPRFAVSHDCPEGVTAVGNAAAALEPIGGEGMGLALRSGELAAEQLLRAGDDYRVDSGRLDSAYVRLWRVRRTACRAAALAITSPDAAVGFLPVLGSLPGAAQVALSLMGK